MVPSACGLFIRIFANEKKKKKIILVKMTTRDRENVRVLFKMFDLIFIFLSFSWKTPWLLGTRMRPKSVRTFVITTCYSFLFLFLGIFSTKKKKMFVALISVFLY